MAYLFSPQTEMELTPGIVCNLSTILFSAYSVNFKRFLMLLCTVMAMMGCAFASAFETTGEHQNPAELSVACETLSRTSLAAVSRSTLNSNSTLILLLPWLLEELIFFTPGIPLIAFSNGSVI